MFRVVFVDDKGRVYTYYGLLESFGSSDDFRQYSFESLDRARKYSNAYISRYPQAAAKIFENNKLVVCNIGRPVMNC